MEKIAETLKSLAKRGLISEISITIDSKNEPQIKKELDLIELKGR